jgi:hypothetical protein
MSHQHKRMGKKTHGSQIQNWTKLWKKILNCHWEGKDIYFKDLILHVIK